MACGHRCVESMNFIKPIAVGDVVCCYGQCLSVGRSSIKIKVEVWVKKVASEPIGERYCVTDAYLPLSRLVKTVNPALFHVKVILN